MNKRQLQAEASKKKIQDVAQALFQMHGYNHVTVNDICQAAGVSVGLFYNYFPSKFDIIHSFIAPLEQRYIELAATFLPSQSVQDKMILLCDCVISNTLLDAAMIKKAKINLIREVEGGDTQLFLHDRELFRIMKDIIVTGQEKKEIRPDIDVEDILRLVYRFVIGSIVYLFNVEGEELKRAEIDKSVGNIKLMLDSFRP